jgi:hypothetical protein
MWTFGAVADLRGLLGQATLNYSGLQSAIAGIAEGAGFALFWFDWEI